MGRLIKLILLTWPKVILSPNRLWYLTLSARHKRPSLSKRLSKNPLLKSSCTGLFWKNEQFSDFNTVKFKLIFRKNKFFSHLKLGILQRHAIQNYENANLSHHSKSAWVISPTWLYPKQLTTGQKVYTHLGFIPTAPAFIRMGPGVSNRHYSTKIANMNLIWIWCLKQSFP